MPLSVTAKAMPRYETMIRVGAVSISLLLHGMLFVTAGGSVSAPAPDNRSNTMTRLTFLTPTAVPEMAREKQERVEAKREIKPREPAKQPEPASEVAEVRKEEVTETVDPQAMQQVASSSSEAVQQINDGLIQQEMERYLSSVMAHIEEHKWYPKSARRRGIEGEVNIRFVLLHDGSAKGVVVENGPNILVAAARRAVEKAAPLPKPPAKIHCPLECEFRMRFSLNAT